MVILSWVVHEHMELNGSIVLANDTCHARKWAELPDGAMTTSQVPCVDHGTGVS